MTEERIALQNTLKGQNNIDHGLVSIVMPNYSCEKYLKATIDSVLNQTYQNWELIVVDDCSKDASCEIIESYRDSRIKLIRNSENSGAAKSRNYAIDAAVGRWITFLDSDDIWQPEKLEKHLAYMLSFDVAFSCTDYVVVDETGKKVTDYKPAKDRYTYNDILKHNVIGCSTVIYDAEKLGKVYMPTDAVKREDFACWLEILKTGEDVHFLHEPLTTYLLRENSVSSNKFNMIKHQWNVYRKLEKMNVIKSAYYIMHWAIKGLMKYR